MTEQEIAGLGPAFASYLGRYRTCFLQKRTAAHFDTYCRGLLSDLPRKSAEPIALYAGTAVRTLQEFLVTTRWDHQRIRDLLQQHLADAVAALPADPLGTIGIIDETSCRKWGDETSGVQRRAFFCQRLGLTPLRGCCRTASHASSWSSRLSFSSLSPSFACLRIAGTGKPTGLRR